MNFEFFSRCIGLFTLSIVLDGFIADVKKVSLPKLEHSRQSRSHKVLCPTRYCETGLMQAMCIPDQRCDNGRRLPSCWFALGKDSTFCVFCEFVYKKVSLFVSNLHVRLNLSERNNNISIRICKFLSSY